MSKRIERTAPAEKESGVSVRARTITRQSRIARAEASTSRQLPLPTEYSSSMMGSAVGANLPLATPYDIDTLFSLIDQSSILPQCIDAYAVNTVESGWEVQPRYRDTKMDPDEQAELQSFIDNANSEESLVAVCSKAVRDEESVGNGYIEVIRDRSGSIALLRHAHALTMRLTAHHPDEQMIKYDIKRGKRIATVTEFRKFRKFVQVVNGKYTYFKEFGDPRDMNSNTGLFDSENGYETGSSATEIIHLRPPSNFAYGVPRWLGNVANLIGSREAEEVNMRFFEDNMIPPVMITVAGGRLTASSFKEIQKVLNSDTGSARQHKMILIEAVGDSDSVSDKNNPIQIKVDKLSSERPSDGLFKEYVDGNGDKIRSSFRLPPVVVGMSQDATFATANVSQFVAETQVFAPARQRIDEVLNHLFVHGRNGLRLQTVMLVARTPSISSPEMMMKALTALNVMGAVTPRTAQMVANSMLQMELPEYPKPGEDGYEEWMDQPISLTIKQAGSGKGPGDSTDGSADDTSGDPNAQSSHDLQSVKDPATKALEKSGDIGPQNPEHGQE